MKHIVFFISHQPNPRFIKQLNYLAKNNHVSLIYFQRSTLANLNDTIASNITQYKLGAIPNMVQPLKRLWTYVKALRKIRKILKKVSFEVLLINNIDVLLLYVLSRFGIIHKHKPKVVIEISDLREFVFSDRSMARKIRFLEKNLYKKYIDKLIVTSKKYYTYHFKKFYTKEVFILENKLLSEEISPPKSTKKPRSDDKTIIGIVGLLLRKDEYIQLFETYKNNPKIDIHIHGKGQYQNVVETYASKYDNITYFGPYNAFKDTQTIYESIDIIYLVYDTDQVSLNNKLALPNKLYECMYYRVPLICSKGTYLEEIVMEQGIGISIQYKVQGEIEKAIHYLKNNSSSIEKNFTALSRNIYIGDDDYKELELFLMK